MIVQLRSSVCLVITCMVSAASAVAQAPLAVSFTDTLETPFTALTSVALNLDDGRMLIADRKDRMVRILSDDWATEDTLASHGEGPGEFVSPVFAFWSDGNAVWIGDAHNRRLSLVSLDDGRGGGGRSVTMPEWMRKGSSRLIGMSLVSPPFRLFDWPHHRESIIRGARVRRAVGSVEDSFIHH